MGSAMKITPGAEVEKLLFDEAYRFDFFQAVRILEMHTKLPHGVGAAVPPQHEVVRFRSHVALHFPPSAIHELKADERGVPQMSVTFMGLLGTLGIMPRHYTELVMRHEREHKGAEVRALREWFDLFNHRLVSLFYRAWKKYRFWMPIERGEAAQVEPDPFTRAVHSLVGLGSPALRGRLRLDSVERTGPPRRLAEVVDQAIIYYGGLFASTIHNARSLEAIIEDYFGLPAEVKQFREQWLDLEPDDRSHLGDAGRNNLLGTNAVAGQRVLDVQGRLGVCLGPLDYEQFRRFLPDKAAVPEGKTFFRLAALVRLYVGQEFAVDLQLRLKSEQVPECRLPESTTTGPQLGWDSWLFSQTPESDRDDTVFHETEWHRIA
jgi:type VI secretion system protein ImpH